MKRHLLKCDIPEFSANYEVYFLRIRQFVHLVHGNEGVSFLVSLCVRETQSDETKVAKDVLISGFASH